MKCSFQKYFLDKSASYYCPNNFDFQKQNYNLLLLFSCLLISASSSVENKVMLTSLTQWKMIKGEEFPLTSSYASGLGFSHASLNSNHQRHSLKLQVQRPGALILLV